MPPEEIGEKTNELQRLSKRVSLLNELAASASSCTWDTRDHKLNVSLKGLEPYDVDCVRRAIHRQLQVMASDAVAYVRKVAGELAGGQPCAETAIDQPGDLE